MSALSMQMVDQLLDAIARRDRWIAERDARIAVLEAENAEQAGTIKRLRRKLDDADGLIEWHAHAEVGR